SVHRDCQAGYVFLYWIGLPPRFTLFPYTTLFRSMNEQGYMAEWQEAAGTFRLSEHNCAIRAVAERFPEVCAAEEQFLRDVLGARSEEHTSELQSLRHLVCRLLLEKKKDDMS